VLLSLKNKLKRKRGLA